MMAGSHQALEEAFVATVDLAERYLALQQALAAALRAGLLSLSAGRYSMGADRVSSLQFPAHMHATARVAATGDGQLALVRGKPGQAAAGDPPRKMSPAGGSAVAKGADPPGAASRTLQPQQGSIQAAESSSSSRGAAAPAGDSAEGELSAALGGLQLKAQSSSLVEELAAKYDCALDRPDSSGSGADDDGGLEGEQASPRRPQRSPLHWFGELVAPALRDAERSFSEVLALALEAASVQRRLLAQLEEYQRLQAAQAPAPQQPAS